MPLLEDDLTYIVAVQRHETVSRGRLGESMDHYITVQQAQGRLFQKTGRAKFGMEGRTDDSSHSFLFNPSYDVYPIAGNPFVISTITIDIQIGDRLVYAPSPYVTQLFRVDNVIDVAGGGDHFEARLTLCLPGGES